MYFFEVLNDKPVTGEISLYTNLYSENGESETKSTEGRICGRRITEKDDDMGIIGLIIFVIIACIAALFSSSEGDGGGGSSFVSYDKEEVRNRPASSAYRRSVKERFEPSDSFFDEDGNEHEVDDEGYCEECDDYHEE